jgi:gliding motility-associated-like protein
MKSFYLLLIISFFAVINSHAQSTKGKEFWFGYIENLVNATPDVYISAEQDVTGLIEIPGLGFTQNFNVVGGTTQSYALPNGALPPYSEGMHNLAVHVTSCDSITVYAVNPGSASADATVVYPSTSLGIDYTVLNMTGSPGDWGDAAVIVATEDNTDIEITPSVNTDGGQMAGVPFTITLNQGELYQLTHNSGADDLTGTTIVGVNSNDCLPFAVFSGSQCINIGGCTACDHIYEQLLPTANLGMSYAAIPLSLKNTTHYRVMATQNNTDVFIDGALVANLNAGQFHQYSDNNFSIITSSAPVAAMQYAEGVSCGGPGDPFQVLLYPIEQSLENITFNAFQTPLVNDYWVNILVETVNVPNVVLDGNSISANFTPFPADPNYSYARINIGAGDHTLTSPGGTLANVYGWGNAESFGYCAGASLKNLTNDFDIVSNPTCINDPVSFSAVPDPLTAGFSWDFGDGSAPVTGQNVTHSYSNPGAYNVTLTKIITNGCDINIIKPMNIISPPIAIDQGDTTVCAGSTLNLNVPTNAPFEVEQVSACGDTIIDWVSANYDTIYWSTGQSGTSIQITPLTDTTIYVYGENYNSTCTAVDSVVILVHDIEADFLAADVCMNDSICLNNQSVSSYPIANSTYYFDNNMLIQDSLNYCFLGGAAGVYDVELVIETSIGCSDSITKQVELLNDPIVDFDYQNACGGGDITFDSQSQANGGAIIGYYWDFDGDTISDFSGQSGSYSIPGGTTIEIIHFVETSNGCTDTVYETVGVYPNPTADFTFTNECEDTLITFTDNSSIVTTGNDVIDQWEWDLDDGNTFNTQNGTHNYDNGGSYNVTLIVTTNNDCKDTVSQQVDVYALPSAAFETDNVCLGDDNSFTDQSVIGGGGVIDQWNWDFADGGSSNNQNPVYTYLAPGSYPVNLEVISVNGCSSDTTIDVSVYPNPTASFDGVNLKGCSPICPVLTSTSQIANPGQITSYDWQFSNGASYTGASMSDCFDNLSANDISLGVTLTVTTGDGCTDTHSESNYIEIYHNPIASFAFSPAQPDVMYNEVTFTNTSSFADSYNWNISDLGDYTSTNPIIEFPGEPNTYDVQLVAITNAGCTDTAVSVIDVDDRIIFYVPNTFTPDNDAFNEQFQPVFTAGYDPQDYSLLIFNRWGEIVFESKDASVGWDGTYGGQSNEIVKDGTYIWKIEFKETMSDQRHTHSGHVNVLK